MINALRAFSLHPFNDSPDSVVNSLQLEANECVNRVKSSSIGTANECNLVIDMIGDYVSR